MLHAVAYDPSIQGGESTFLDTFGAAEDFRAREPEHFEALCRIPATFMKDHLERSSPAQMYYRRPHISVGAPTGDDSLSPVNGVFWSPPFEGPLRAESTDDVRMYYQAYRAFAEWLGSVECEARWLMQLRLREGDLVSFNQRRMLHGRNAFFGGEGERHLQGCYLNIDDFLSRHRALALRFAGEDTAAALPVRGMDTVPRCSNQTW
jgi:gamma-butyrobetaine dioxygenase